MFAGVNIALPFSSLFLQWGERHTYRPSCFRPPLTQAGLTVNGPIVVTQPRRVAAVAVATRVAEEMGVELGSLVGYEIRFDHCATPGKTKIKYVTDGCLLRECLQNPSLSQYSCVIFDEAHVRSMETDILFGLAKTSILMQQQKEGKKKGAGSGGRGRNVPKLIIMSATLESEKFSTFFNRCSVFNIPGRTHPVTLTYSSSTRRRADTVTPGYVQKAVDMAMEVHLAEQEGDILIFLTGQAEIERACKDLYSRSEQVDYRRDVQCTRVNGLMILPLFGSMSSESQRAIFAAAEPGIRKVVVATDIASTSLTINGVVFVIDSGYVKEKRFNAATGLDILQVVPISRSEAKQRAGRAGRTCPGRCHKLYSRSFEEEEMDENTAPEIMRTSLTAVVLLLKTIGIDDVLTFPYLDPPAEQVLLEALRQLYFYDAITSSGEITPLGLKMGAFPLAPSLARVLLYAANHSSAGLLLPVVAMLTVEQLFIRPGHKAQLVQAEAVHNQLRKDGGDDFNVLLHIFIAFSNSQNKKQFCHSQWLHYRSLAAATKVHNQLQLLITKMDFSKSSTSGGGGGGGGGGSGGGGGGGGGGGSAVAGRAAAGTHKFKDDDDAGTKRTRKRMRTEECKSKYNPPAVVNGSVQTAVRKALCFGYFNHVARRNGNSFRTMDGHASAVGIHPSSGLFEQQDALDWVLYLEVVTTSRPYMRTCTPILYEWVKALLPKLHDVKAHMLSGKGALSDSDRRVVEAGGGGAAREAGGGAASSGSGATVPRTNTDSSIAAAKERYLARKSARQKGAGGV